MKVQFIIDKDYLILHTLASIKPSDFSSNKNKKDIVSFQKYANEFLTKQNFSIEKFFIDRPLKRSEITKKVKKHLATFKKGTEFQSILKQTENYLLFCKKQWKKNYPQTRKVMVGLTGLKFEKSFIVYLTHPSLRNGQYIGSNKLAWGHYEDWPNYTTIYLWHEILHSYVLNTPKNHALIELITDNELRIRLNGGKYPPFSGHKELKNLMQKFLPHFQEFLKSYKTTDIFHYFKKIRL